MCCVFQLHKYMLLCSGHHRHIEVEKMSLPGYHRSDSFAFIWQKYLDNSTGEYSNHRGDSKLLDEDWRWEQRSQNERMRGVYCTKWPPTPAQTFSCLEAQWGLAFPPGNQWRAKLSVGPSTDVSDPFVQIRKRRPMSKTNDKMVHPRGRGITKDPYLWAFLENLSWSSDLKQVK